MASNVSDIGETGGLASLRAILNNSSDPEVDLVLSQHDAASRDALLELLCAHLEQGGSVRKVDTRILRLCLKLLSNPEHRTHYFPKLRNHVFSIVSKDPGNDTLYDIAAVCTVDAPFCRDLFDDIFAQLRLLDEAITANAQNVVHQGETFSTDIYVTKAGRYLNFLTTSYWLPPKELHYITPGVVQILVGLCRCDRLGDAARGAISALLALLRNHVNILHPYDSSQSPCMTSDAQLDALGYPRTVIAQQLWNMLRDLPRSAFTTNSSSLFRTWFQWTSHMRENNVELEGVYDPTYWDRLRVGLLEGFGEQRKYCLGILSHSLQLARHDIYTPFMQLTVGNIQMFAASYRRFSNLFETIVLDRYANQVQACLPELTSLLGPGSLITPVWIETLLSAALNAKIQEGIRKIIGQWFMGVVMSSESSSLTDYANFFVDGFLPWAAQGSLFINTLVSNRKHTICHHGETLARVSAKFVIAMATTSERRQVLSNVLQFIIERGGKIFQHSILYLLDGLLQGFTDSNSLGHLHPSNVQSLLEVSRQSGLPEVASDLCTAYCADFCKQSSIGSETLRGIPGYGVLEARFTSLQGLQASKEIRLMEGDGNSSTSPSLTLAEFLKHLSNSHHEIIQGDRFASACDTVSRILGGPLPDVNDLYLVLEAFWDEAERQEFRRAVALRVPSLFFHPTCLRTAIAAGEIDEGNNLVRLLREVMTHLGKLAVARVYLISGLLGTIRTSCAACPRIFNTLPVEDLLLQFIKTPPLPKTEFLFEAAAAEKLQRYLPNRSYTSYYGKREWHAFASLIDLLVRLPDNELDLAKQLLRHLIEPWRTQKIPILVVSKWKNVFQLQVMLLLTEYAVSETDAKWYLDALQYALVVEPWPRYRFLLEWIICRIYSRYPQHAGRLLHDLSSSNDADPRYVASLMKLAVLCAPFLDSEEFAHQLLLKLIPFSASQKVHIRHESQWSFPIVWQLAEQKGWTRITNNEAFRVLNDHIRQLDRYSAYPSTIRTIRLDIVEDFTLTHIFQGDYLRVETPEREVVAHEDFIELWKEDEKQGLQLRSSRIPLGSLTVSPIVPASIRVSESRKSELLEDAIPYQTKSGFDLNSLLPAQGSPSNWPGRPSPVVLVASLIDNPTNLGGLSRISESFGLQALYIDSLSKTGSKEFQSTAVTSHKHLPIKELKPAATPDFLVSMKREGYTVVAVEQTDRSGVLGEVGPDSNTTDIHGRQEHMIGTLPKRCVLVLGSEKGGVAPEVLAVVDRCVEIRTVGVTRSLNVQTAAGIAVYEWWREWGRHLREAA